VRDFNPAYDGFGSKPGKAQIEHKISASPPIPDIRADIVVRRFVPNRRHGGLG
jgi:hypothetical protein